MEQLARATRQRGRRQPADGRAARFKEGRREPRPRRGARAFRARTADAAARTLRREFDALRLVGQVRRALPVRAAVVPDHRRARLGQDDRAAQLRAEVSARRFGRRPRGARRRRHAPLRLVVHRPGRADRHRRALHDARQRPRDRPQHLERLSENADEGAAAPAGQRRARDRRAAGSADARCRRACAPRRHRAAARAGAAAGPRHPLPDLFDGHEVRPDGRVHGLLRHALQGPARHAVGLHVPARRATFCERASHGIGALRCRVRAAATTPDRRPDRPPAGRARPAAPGGDLRLPEPVRRRRAGAARVRRRCVLGLEVRRRPDAARRVLRQRHPGGHADRPHPRLRRAQLPARARDAGAEPVERQELLPLKAAERRGVRRERPGRHEPQMGAAPHAARRGRLRARRPRHRRCARGLERELREQPPLRRRRGTACRVGAPARADHAEPLRARPAADRARARSHPQARQPGRL